MTKLLILFIASVLFSTLIIFLRKPFYRVAVHTVSLLDALLDEAEDTVKQKQLISRLGKLMASLFLFFAIIGLGLVFIYYSVFAINGFNDVDFELAGFVEYSVLIGGSILPFIFLFAFGKKKGDYSEESKLLHTLILDNYNVSKSLSALDGKIFKKKLKKENQQFLIVSGLARSGTTALSNQLFSSGNFYSLDYANMPFLLAPNIWRKFYRPNQNTLKERSHGDRVMIGYNSIEALEEHFYKVWMNDSFIGEKTIQKHEVQKDIYDRYIDYQKLIAPENTDSIYLAKNNNLIVRYESLREINKNFKVIFIYRDPIEHSFSLYKQHKRYTKMQKDDLFVLKYMSWLGHHEFGMSLKYFDFPETKEVLITDDMKMEHWLKIWINYYRHLLDIDDGKFVLLKYEDYLNKPAEMLSKLMEKLNIDLKVDSVNKFENANKFDGEVDEDTKQKAYQLLTELDKRKLTL